MKETYLLASKHALRFFSLEPLLFSSWVPSCLCHLSKVNLEAAALTKRPEALCPTPVAPQRCVCTCVRALSWATVFPCTQVVHCSCSNDVMQSTVFLRNQTSENGFQPGSYQLCHWRQTINLWSLASLPVKWRGWNTTSMEFKLCFRVLRSPSYA